MKGVDSLGQNGRIWPSQIKYLNDANIDNVCNRNLRYNLFSLYVLCKSCSQLSIL